MALFRRNRNLEATSLEQYYASQHRQGPMSWLMVGFALLSTAVIVLGLFWGAGWLYKKTKHDNKKATTASIIDTKTEGGTVTVDNSSSTSAASADKQSTGGVTTPDTKPATSTDPSSTNQSATTAPSKTSVVSSTKLPSTGPGNSLGIFVAVSIFAAVTYNLILRRTV